MLDDSGCLKQQKPFFIVKRNMLLFLEESSLLKKSLAGQTPVKIVYYKT